MKEVTIRCDVCKESGALTCYFYLDRKMDGAGSMDDIEEPVDLCAKHQWAAYKLAEQLLTFEQRQTVLENLKAKRTRIMTGVLR